MYYSIQDCDRLLVKIANIGQAVPGQEGSNGSPLGTMGQDIGGSASSGEGGGGQKSSSGGKVNKDHLYERLIQEKDNLSRLKVLLASSGQLPPDMMQDQSSNIPLQELMQQSMIQDMQNQQTMQQPVGMGGQSFASPTPNMEIPQTFPQGMYSQASLKKHAFAPIALASTAMTAHQGLKLGRDVTNFVGNSITGVGKGIQDSVTRARMANNPLIGTEQVMNAFRRQPLQVDNKSIGSLGRLESSRNFQSTNQGMSQGFINKFSPKKVSGDYNGF